MSNAQVLLPPDPTHLVSGRVDGSAAINRAGTTLNWALAQACTWPILYMMLPDTSAGLFDHVGAAVDVLEAPLAVPILSLAHRLAFVRVRGTVAGGGGSAKGHVIIKTWGGAPPVGAPASTVTLDLDVGGPDDYSTTITISTAGEWDYMTLEASTDDGATMTIYLIEVSTYPIADPIPAGLAFATSPLVVALGIDSLSPDGPHDAGLNALLHDDAEHIRDRWRPLWSWVGIATALGGGPMAARPYRTWVPMPAGGAAVGLTCTVRMYLRNDLLVSAYVYLQMGNDGQAQRHRIEVEAETEGWYTYTFVPLEEIYLVDLPVEGLKLMIWPGPAGVPGRSTAEVCSLTVVAA